MHSSTLCRWKRGGCDSVLHVTESGSNYPPIAFKEIPPCEDSALSHLCVFTIFCLVCRCRLAVAAFLTCIEAKSHVHSRFFL